KTLAFNGCVLIASCSAQIWLHTGGSPLPLSSAALWLIGLVAACNLVLRMVTERPVWWRQLSWSGLDLAQGESETVYHKAAEFVERSDFTDVKEREAARRIQPYAEFSRDLDKRLVDTREAFTATFPEEKMSGDGQVYGSGPHVLPLDADERAS